MNELAPSPEEIELRLLLEAIRARYGYDFREYAEASMRRRVLAALAHFEVAHIGEIQHRILHDRAFFSRFVEHLTVRVTEIFRDPSMYRALRKTVVPLLRTYPILRVWHAGCASGEEVYGFAILLREEGLYDRAQIYATDLSMEALEEAKAAIYPASRLPAVIANYANAGGRGALSDHLTDAYDHFVVGRALRRNVVFFQHDLVCDDIFGEMHIIFCRNALIYFEESLRLRVLAKLAASLRPGGFLCLGGRERLSREAMALGFSEFSHDERIYRRTATGGALLPGGAR